MPKAKYKHMRAGQRFGSWVVYEQDYCTKTRKITCRCDCGVIKSVAAKDLAQGKTTRCFGCTRKHPVIKKGDVFGRWTAVADEAFGRAFFRCSCGYQTKSINVSDIRDGRSTQCTLCSRKHRLFKRGDRVGSLLVLEDEPYKTRRSQKDRVLCRCRCGQKREVLISCLNRGGKSRELSCRRCARRGRSDFHGMSGTKEYRRVSAAAYRALKGDAAGECTIEQWTARSEYYGHKCIYCGSSENMSIDHRIPLSRGGSNWPSNLAPACRSCNTSKRAKTEKEYKKWLSERKPKERCR